MPLNGSAVKLGLSATLLACVVIAATITLALFDKITGDAALSVVTSIGGTLLGGHVVLGTAAVVSASNGKSEPPPAAEPAPVIAPTPAPASVADELVLADGNR